MVLHWILETSIQILSAPSALPIPSQYQFATVKTKTIKLFAVILQEASKTSIISLHIHFDCSPTQVYSINKYSRGSTHSTFLNWMPNTKMWTTNGTLMAKTLYWIPMCFSQLGMQATDWHLHDWGSQGSFAVLLEGQRPPWKPQWCPIANVHSQLRCTHIKEKGTVEGVGFWLRYNSQV